MGPWLVVFSNPGKPHDMHQIDVYYLCMNQNHVNLASLDLNLITALSALLEHRSVTVAARHVGRTQSAMSHSLTRLRDHFHDPILVRDGWTMQLTPFGERLRPRAHRHAEPSPHQLLLRKFCAAQYCRLACAESLAAGCW